MSLLTAPINFLARRLLRFISRIEHLRNHRGVSHHAAVDKKAARSARQAWWGSDPRWYPDGTEPRRHNRITPLVDGDRFLHELHAALAQAEHYVFIAALVSDAVSSALHRADTNGARRFPPRRSVLGRGGPAGAGARHPTLGWRAVLSEPDSRRSALHYAGRRASAGRGDPPRAASTDTARFTHCHHQKAIVVDGQVAFVGGMDLTTFLGDRWDTPGHPLRAGLNWHDVQLRIEGEAVADVEHNFRQRWEAVPGDRDFASRPAAIIPTALTRSAPDPAWHTPAQIVRTIPPPCIRFAPRGEFGIYHAYMEALRRPAA